MVCHSQAQLALRELTGFTWCELYLFILSVHHIWTPITVLSLTKLPQHCKHCIAIVCNSPLELSSIIDALYFSSPSSITPAWS